MDLRQLLNHVKKLYAEPLFLRKYGSDLEFKGEVPDVLKSDDYIKEENSDLYLPGSLLNPPLWRAGSSVSYRFNFTALPPMRSAFLGEEEGEVKEGPPFEVNMMEALVGWKSWFFDGGMLTSAQNCKWKPLEQMEAMCPGHTQLYGGAPLKCRHIPAEHHTCGFYAVNHPSQVMDDDEVVGQVYGWGRYVRGDNGWRAQFAYPKSFHLKAEQSDLVEPLRAYGVPIYLEQPMQVYFPEEDGYGHGQDNENGNLGAAQGSGSSEGDGHEASED